MACYNCHSDSIKGDGEVPRQVCLNCHNKPHQLDRYGDTNFIHDNHITKHKLACFSCHIQIQHGLAPKPSIVTESSCNSCHEQTHGGPAELYRGVGGKGVPDMRGVLGHFLVAASLVGIAKKRFGDPLNKVPVWGSFAAVGATAVMLLTTGIAMAMMVPAPHVAAAGSGKHVDYTWGERRTADVAASILADKGVFADDRVLDATLERERRKVTLSLRTSSEAWTDATLVAKAQDAADALASREGGEVSVEIRSEFGLEQKTLTGRKGPAFR